MVFSFYFIKNSFIWNTGYCMKINKAKIKVMVFDEHESLNIKIGIEKI